MKRIVRRAAALWRTSMAALRQTASPWEAIEESGLFDLEYVREQIADERLRGESAGSICQALAQDRELFEVSPSPLFDPEFYGQRYPDVANYGAHPFLHFIRHGFYEARQPHPLIDPPHLWTGARRAGQTFEAPADLPAAVRAADPNILFSNRFVRAKYGPIVEEYRSPLEFYLRAPEPRVKQASVWFAPERYLSEHPDLVDRGQDPLTHFLSSGERLHLDPAWVRGILSAHGIRPEEHGGPLPWPSAAAGYEVIEHVPDPELAGAIPDPAVVVVGVVLFRTDRTDFERLVRSVDREASAAGRFPGVTVELRLAVNDQRAGTYREWLREASPASMAAEVMDSGSNVGFGRAHNRLMSEAFASGATHYVGLNPDGFMMRGSLEGLLRLTGALSDDALIEADAFPVGHPKWFDPVGFDTAWVSGAAFLMPRKIHEVVGGFDERFFMYCEDVDLSWRVREAGFRTVVCPTAPFYHDVAPRLDAVDPKATRAMFMSARMLGRKWGDEAFVQRMEDILVEQGLAERGDLPALGPVERIESPIPDFDHDLRFALSRYW